MPRFWYRAGCKVDDRMARGKAYCSFGEHTAKRRAQCTEHTAVHMASYTCCENRSSHMVSDMGGNCWCMVDCTCENKSGDAHTGGHMGNGTVPDNTCHRYHDTCGHIAADAHRGPYIQPPPGMFCRSIRLPGCGHTIGVW